MTTVRRPNRRGLEGHETDQLDAAVAEYEAARRAAYDVYISALGEAVRTRDRIILAIIDAGPRSTQARVAEYLGMQPGTLTAMRRRRAALRV